MGSTTELVSKFQAGSLAKDEVGVNKSGKPVVDRSGPVASADQQAPYPPEKYPGVYFTPEFLEVLRNQTQMSDETWHKIKNPMCPMCLANRVIVTGSSKTGAT